jgi:hypothetical protein
MYPGIKEANEQANRLLAKRRKNSITHDYLECMCDSAEHVLRVSADPTDEYMPLWLEVHLVQHRRWYQRLGVAIRYVFGYRSKYGDFDTVCLDTPQAYRLLRLIDSVYPEKTNGPQTTN